MSKQPDYVLGQFVEDGRIITYEHDYPPEFYGSNIYARFRVYVKPVKYWHRSFLEKRFPNFFKGIVKRWMLSRRIVSQINKH